MRCMVHFVRRFDGSKLAHCTPGSFIFCTSQSQSFGKITSKSVMAGCSDKRECDESIPVQVRVWFVCKQQWEKSENVNPAATYASSKHSKYVWISFKRQQCKGSSRFKEKIRFTSSLKSKAKKAVVSKIGMEDGCSPLVKKFQPFSSVP